MIIQVSEKHASSEKPEAKDGVLLNNQNLWVNTTHGEDNIGMAYGYTGVQYFTYYEELGYSYKKECPPFPSGTVVTLVQE